MNDEIELVIKIPKELYSACDGAKNVVGDGSMYDLLIDAVGNGAPLDNIFNKIRAEIEKAIWEDVVVSLDGTDETKIPRLDPDDVFEIIDKYKAESEDKE